MECSPAICGLAARHAVTPAALTADRTGRRNPTAVALAPSP
jgi:hypothetical protein